MSTYRTDYIICGWKLPHTKENQNINYNEKNNLYELIIDRVLCNYIVFGKILYKKDYQYENAYVDNHFEFENITLPSVKEKKEIKRKYIECFNCYVDKDKIAEPYIFIFSHIY